MPKKQWDSCFLINGFLAGTFFYILFRMNETRPRMSCYWTGFALILLSMVISPAKLNLTTDYPG
jgi:hypothetical protein